MKKYTKTHEWTKAEDGVLYVGISRHAVHELGDIVYVELPEVGADVTAGAPACEIESVKAVAEVNSPVTGSVCKVNDALEGSPELLVGDPDAWIFAVQPSEVAEGLMTEEEYLAYLG